MNTTARKPSPATAPRYNGMAMTALVAACFVPIGWPVAGIAGRAAMNERDILGDAAGGGMWMATVGRVVGWIWAALMLLSIGFIYGQLL